MDRVSSLWRKGSGYMKCAKYILAIVVLGMAELAGAQMKIGENTKLNAGALFTFGYQGDYGDQIQTSHGLDFGVDGKLNGSYYNPNFLSFQANPYYNQYPSCYKAVPNSQQWGGTLIVQTSSTSAI